MTEQKRCGRARVVVASSLALVVALSAGIGAPSSEFVPKDSWWWTLDPLMWPTLFGGVVLALVALGESVVGWVRGGAIVCVLASLSTVTGILIAAGTSNRQALAFYAVFAGVTLIPAVVAVSVFHTASPR